MAQEKKFTMRPARKGPGGKLAQVKFNGGRSAIAKEETRTVTPDLHRAFLAGDLEIDGYTHKPREAKRPAAKKKAPKKAAKKAPKPKPAADKPAANKTEES